MNTMMEMPSTASQMDSLAFLAFPAKRAGEQVSGTTEDIFKTIGTILSSMFADVLTKRSAAQYCAARSEYMLTYTQVMIGLGSLITATVSEQVIDRLTHESLSEMEADFRDHGVAAFGAEINDQALFTVWTLRKINDLASRICATDAVKPHLVPADREQAMRFVMHVLHGRFHLDCLKSSLRTGTPIYPEVLGCISEGLRSVVNGYSHIKQACDLRNTEENEEMIFIDFDEEERELLASSMADAFQ